MKRRTKQETNREYRGEALRDTLTPKIRDLLEAEGVPPEAIQQAVDRQEWAEAQVAFEGKLLRMFQSTGDFLDEYIAPIDELASAPDMFHMVEAEGLTPEARRLLGRMASLLVQFADDAATLLNKMDEEPSLRARATMIRNGQAEAAKIGEMIGKAFVRDMEAKLAEAEADGFGVDPPTRH